MALIWEDPPQIEMPKNTRQEEADELRANPRRWAIVQSWDRTVSGRHRVDASALARNIRKGNLGAFKPAGSFEAVMRTTPVEYRVYARYVGEPVE